MVERIINSNHLKCFIRKILKEDISKLKKENEKLWLRVYLLNDEIRMLKK